ncbi:NAD(P)-dependent oxidoreductase [Pseudalkalibacillus sp. SCS-8]|uniref:NAD-dependent epimerase/dehydratase family protein n=1 Tax=Pseudalkalibacillus nanhaiensis TaxID=3115291 RepID=UPI0032DACB4F
MKRVLITGVAGEVGMILANAFIDKGIDVYGVDHVNRETHEGLDLIGRNALFHFNNQSISEIDWSAEDPVDVIFHLAQSVPTSPRISEIKKSVSQSLSNMKRLVAFAAESGAKVVIISSTDVFGPILTDYGKKDLEPAPRSLYGTLMLAEETFLKRNAKKDNVPYHIVRLPCLMGSNHPISDKCHAIDTDDKAGFTTEERENSKEVIITREEFIEICLKIINDDLDESIITLFNK